MLFGNQKQSHNVGRAGFSEWWKVPSCVLHHCFDKLIDSFRLYNFFLCAQALTHNHPSETYRGKGAKTKMLIYYKFGTMNPGLLRLGLGALAPTCAGGF